MKIIKRKEFLSLPEGALFSKFKPCFFGALSIKGETLGQDFIDVDIADAFWCEGIPERVDGMFAAIKEGKDIQFNLELDERYCRDGMFEEDQLFAVWEKADIDKLIAALTDTVDYPQGK